MIGHDGSNAEMDLDFGPVASRRVGDIVETKICERCAQQFFRSAFLPRQHREKLCGGCRARMRPHVETESLRPQ